MVAKPPGPPKPPSLGESNEFDLARRRAAQQETANLQLQKDAIARRAAQLGGGVQGSMIKQEALAADASAQRLGQAHEGIDTAQRAEERRLREVQEGREFTTSERLGSEKFIAGESALQRRLAEAQLTGVYDGKDTFAKTEAAANRAMADKAFKESVRQSDREFKANIGANTAALIANWKEHGYKPAEIKTMLRGIGYEDIYDSLGLSAMGQDPTQAVAVPTTLGQSKQAYRPKSTGPALSYWTPGSK
jgi:hypothetical protein